MSGNEKVMYESGETAYTMEALTDSGDATTFTSQAALFSKRSGFDIDPRPDGVLSGCVITPAASGTNDLVDMSAGTAWVGGVLKTIAAVTDLAITRATPTDTHKISSVVYNGTTVSASAGTDATAFSATRAAAGGPPLIAVGSIELGQVKLASNSAAAITAAEIEQKDQISMERALSPGWTVDYASGKIVFGTALPLIHTGAIPKGVFAAYAEPDFSEIEFVNDFVPPAQAASVTSTEYLGGKVKASVSKSLSAGSFKTILNNGVTDPILQADGQWTWIRHFPDRNKSEKIDSLAFLTITDTHSAGKDIEASVTLAAEFKAVRRVS